MLKVGDKAPAFTLVSDETTEVSLEDFKGKNVVVLFFPLAFTGVCTTELCGMRDNIATYNDLDAQILAISVDSPFSLKKFKEEQQLNFPLLSDFNKEISRAYGAHYESFVLGLRGVAKMGRCSPKPSCCPGDDPHSQQYGPGCCQAFCFCCGQSGNYSVRRSA